MRCGAEHRTSAMRRDSVPRSLWRYSLQTARKCSSLERRSIGFHRCMDDPAAELCERGALQRLLDRQAALARRGHVAVAFMCGARVATAGVDGDKERLAPIGCVAKVLTAALASAAVARRDLSFDAGVCDLLARDVAALRGVTVRHLLEHTHGLDDSLLSAPRYRHGFIDADELCSRVAALTRWAAPGAVYSYGNAGAWLVAATLERVRGRAYAAHARVSRSMRRAKTIDGRTSLRRRISIQRIRPSQADATPATA